MLLNQVYQYNDSNQRIRVVYETLEFVWVINIDEDSAWPIPKPISDLYELIASQVLQEIREPFTFPHIEFDSTQALRRDNAYALLKILLENHNELLYKASRNS